MSTKPDGAFPDPRPGKEQLILFNKTTVVGSDVHQKECWEILDPKNNPPEKEACSVPMTRDILSESCSGKSLNVTYSANPTEAKASNQPLMPPSNASAPRPPRIPNPNLERPTLKDDSRHAHIKMCRMISSMGPISEKGKCVPCVNPPIPMSFFNPNILPESPSGGDEGLAKRYKPNSMESPDVQHATNSVPSSGEHTIRLFGKSITAMITSSEEEEVVIKHRSGKEPTSSEEEEAVIKHRSGKEPVASHGIDNVVKLKDATMDTPLGSIQRNEWIRNESRITKRNTDVVGGSGEEAAGEERVPSAAAMAMVGRALNNAPPFQIKKMSGYSVWDS